MRGRQRNSTTGLMVWPDKPAFTASLMRSKG
jgi:hypothetical protein